MSYIHKAMKGIISLLFSSIIASFLSYGIRIILARQLSPVEYGLFYGVFNLISFTLIFRRLGLYAALIKFIPTYTVRKELDRMKTAVTLVIGWSTLFTLLYFIAAFFLAEPLAEHFFKDSRAAGLLLWFTAYILISGFALILKSIFFGMQKPSLYAIFEPLKNITSLSAIIIAFSLGYTYYVPLIGFIVGFLVMFILYLPFFFYYFSYFTYKIKSVADTGRQLLDFGIPVIFTSFAARIIGNVDTVMLVYFTTLETVGIYNVILPSAMVFLFLGSSVSSVFMPMVSELWEKKETKKVIYGLHMIYRYAFVTTIPFILTLIMFADIFIHLFFGEAYVGGANPMRILLIGILCYIVADINNAALSGFGKPQKVTKIIVIAAVFNIILNALLIPLYGMMGAAIATTLSYVSILLFSLREVGKEIQIRVPIISWTKTVIAGLAFSGVIFYLKRLIVLPIWYEFIITVGSGFIIYCALIFVLRILSQRDITQIYYLVKRKAVKR